MHNLQSLYENHLESLNRSRVTATAKCKYSLVSKLCSHLGSTPVEQITYPLLSEWFNGLTYFQQCKAKMALERFFDELIAEKRLPEIDHNPFGKGTGRLHCKEKPPKERQRLLNSELTAIRNSAISDGCMWFVHAIDLSYLLKLRRQDVTTLEFSSHDKASKTLSKLILKSAHQLGKHKGLTLSWDLTEGYGKDVAKIIAEARTTRIMDIRYKSERSPYVVHYRPERVANEPAKGKTHHSQVTDQLLSRTFQKYRNSVPSIAARCEADGSKQPTFHEIRSLSARNDYDKGVSKDDISQALAHSHTTVTDLYLDDQVINVVSLNRIAEVV